MADHLGQDIWYLLNMFHSLGYSVLFVLGMIWLRLILRVFEEALCPRKKKLTHRCVHPLGPFRTTRIELESTTESKHPSPSESDSTQKKNLCI